MDAPNDSLDLVDRLVAEYADRLARGEDPRREELLARAPQFRAELERCFRMLEPGDEPVAGALAVGERLGDFRLRGELGRGGMAVVYEAEQESLRRSVALKVLRHHLTLDAKHLERFQREARAAAKLAHDNVVPIHAVGEANGHAYIAFELVRGPTLARVIGALAASGARPTAADLARASGRAALAQAQSYGEACVGLLAGVLEAVEFAHGQGVIHRDLKPSNVLLTAAGKPLVADFGLAKDLGEASLSITGETIGTPHYMAPEQASALAHRVDARTDVYALGVLLYELLTLRRPFEGGTLQQLMHSIVTLAPPAPAELAPDVPEALSDVVLKAMAKVPAQRYASVAAFRADLERALRGDRVQARSTQGLAELFGGYFEAKMRGAPFEYRSRRTVLGLPWIHVASGVRDPRTKHLKWARGVIAAGDQALGLYAAGKLAIGLLAFGLIAIGPVALGVLAVGGGALGAIALGGDVQGVFVAGHSGQGLIDEWLVVEAPPLPESELDPLRLRGPGNPFTISLVCVVISVTMTYGVWTRMWPGEAERAFLRRVTRAWMPFAYLAPCALYLAGIDLPFLANLLLVAVITLAFSLFVKRTLGKPGASAG